MSARVGLCAAPLWRRQALRRLAGVSGAILAGCTRGPAAADAPARPSPTPIPPTPSPPLASPLPPAAAQPRRQPEVHAGAAGLAPIVRGTLLATDEATGPDGRSRTLLTCVDLDAATLQGRSFEIPFYGHGFAVDPRDAGRCLVFEKKGPGCCLVDLRVGRVVAVVPPRPGRQFYGHGVFNKDGAFVFCTETYVEDGSLRGVIAVRDSNTLAWKADLPSHGASPHDLHLAPDQRHLVVTNGGGPGERGDVPNLAFIDLRTHQLRRRLPLSDRGVNAGHVALHGDDRAVVVSAPRDGLVVGAPGVHGGIAFWRGAEGEAARLESAAGPAAAAMAGETLSVAIDRQRRVAIATNPRGHQLTRWDLDSGALLQESRAFIEPRGVACTLDGRELALSCGQGSELVMLDPSDLQPLPGRRIDDAFSGGAHLHVIALDHERGSGRRRA